MLVALIVVLYVAGIVVATWPLYQRMERWGDPEFTTDLTFAIIVALFWPLIVAGLACFHASRAIWGVQDTERVKEDR